LKGGIMSDAEDYTYSAVWLAFGVALLAAGILLKSYPARLASARVVILTIAKVFLHDLAGVQGIFRALSFIGLGLVLMGIGWLYQRLLFPSRPSAGAAAPEPMLDWDDVRTVKAIADGGSLGKAAETLGIDQST